MLRFCLLLLLWVGMLPCVQAQRFAAIGDYGYAGPAERDVANLVKSWHPDFIITLGDNNYEIGDSLTIDQNIGQYYHEYIKNYKGRYGPSASTERFFPALGNHDLYTVNGMPYLAYFTLPGNERYYDFVEGNVHFFVLNSGPYEPDGTESTSRQAQWLQQRLKASVSRWNIVYLHHAPYSSGAHGSTEYMRWPFEEWGASAVLAGHDHVYERLQIRNIPYFVNGLGGRSLYPLSTQRLPESKVIYNTNYGAMLLTASADTLSFQFFTRDKQRIDSYTLRKPRSSTKLELYGAVPNPFHTTTRLEVATPQDILATLRVVNTAGQEVATIYQGKIAAGKQQFTFSRGGLRSGIYFVQLLSNEQPSRVVRLELL